MAEVGLEAALAPSCAQEHVGVGGVVARGRPRLALELCDLDRALGRGRGMAGVEGDQQRVVEQLVPVDAREPRARRVLVLLGDDQIDLGGAQQWQRRFRLSASALAFAWLSTYALLAGRVRHVVGGRAVNVATGATMLLLAGWLVL